MDKWSSFLTHIVFRGSEDVTGGFLQRLSKCDKEIKDMMMWPRSLNPEEPEEVIKFASEDDSNCITLHKKVVIWNESNEYLLQEASTDGFCSFVISAPMTQLDVNASFFSRRWRDTLLQTSGFAIMPEPDDVTEFLSGLVGVVIEEIHEEGVHIL
ncbi:hypothetical protein F0562_006534 [Nyssa sinensis]|uniref:HD-Zip IV C-terminal domain-containing protein n=1 Tax=Nyssa sinensis TaxID=561372 RepID=A0A5J5ANE0_9ASTE|nr:hypothetical protein F0562_006534 [Nyssa sinensis]